MRSKATYPPELEQWLAQNFKYDEQTGQIIQLCDRFSPRGQILSKAGPRSLTKNESGYLILTTKLGNRNYLIRAHRLAFFLKEGKWPHTVDHINGNKQDNRWCNLRNVDDSVNALNRFHSWGKNSHLPIGIYRLVKNGYDCFKSSVTWRGKHYTTYKNTLEKAVAWRAAKMEELGIA